MLRVARYLRIGVGMTVLALVAATALSIGTGLQWALVATLALTIASVIALLFAVSTDEPVTNQDDGARDIAYEIESSGLNTAGSGLIGGRSSFRRPSGALNAQAIVNSLLPLLIAVLLVILWYVF